jgi:hypothetical protein
MFPQYLGRQMSRERIQKRIDVTRKIRYYLPKSGGVAATRASAREVPRPEGRDATRASAREVPRPEGRGKLVYRGGLSKPSGKP